MSQFQMVDAQAALGFVVSQASHIETEVNRTIYPDIQYASLIPVDSSANPFTQTVEYRSSDIFGKAKWINGNSDDIPLAGSEMANFKTNVYSAGIGYGYGWEEINVAMMLGQNLQADDALAARRAYEEMVDNTMLRGDTEKGFSGLFNYPGVPVTAAPNGDWDDPATTEDQVLADFNAIILGVTSGTLYTSMANTVILPPAKLNSLATRRLGDTSMTILEFLRKNNTYTAMSNQPLDIRVARGLETAGAGATNRMIAYRKAPDVLKAHIPMPHRFLPVWQDGPLHWVVPGVFRLGGLDIRKKLEVRYSDGI